MADVYLSPSVRHFNQGYGTYGTEEARMNLIADVVALELARAGLSVDRNDPQQDLTAVVADANARGSDIYVAIRSIPCEGGFRGPAVYYFREGSNGQRLAQGLYAQLAPLYPAAGRGAQNGSGAYGGLGYYELRRTRPPAVIVEVGCHSDPAEADFILSNIYELGVAITRGILDYFGLDYTPLSDQEAQRLMDEYNNVYFE